GQFTGQQIGALLEFVFILKPGVEPLEIRPVPKHVGLFRHRNQTRYALLNEQRVSDVLQDRPASARGAAVLGQFARQWFGGVEDGTDVPFVVRQNQIRCQRIGDDEYVLGQQRLQRDDTGWRDLFIFFRRNFDLGGFFFGSRKSPADTSIEASNDFIFLRRRHSDEDGNSVSKKDNEGAGVYSKSH